MQSTDVHRSVPRGSYRINTTKDYMDFYKTTTRRGIKVQLLFTINLQFWESFLPARVGENDLGPLKFHSSCCRIGA